MYEDVCYKKPFLKEVIFKTDFPSPLLNIEKRLPPKVTKTILTKFPLSEPQKSHTQEFQIAGADFQAKSTETMQWVFHDKLRKKTLAITPEALTYVNRSYKTFEKLLDDTEDVLNVLFSELEDVTAGRLGLRYVNIIDLDEEKPLAWDSYINEEILGVIDFHDENHSLTRAFHILEYNFDGLAVKFQFGIANPDFPAVVRKKQFVIDIDAYAHGAFELGDIRSFIVEAHSKIQDIFEKSITEKTRTLMKPQNG